MATVTARLPPFCRILRRQQRRPHQQHLVISRCTSKISSPKNTKKVASTQKWFERVVIGEKLCPFASPLLKQKGLLRIVPTSAASVEEAIADVKKEVYDLVCDPEATHETTLVVLDDYEGESGTPNFVYDYMEFVRLSWELQTEAVGEAYASKVQLVLFHPRATHQTYGSMAEDDDDNGAAGDYTIRSPFPTVHLLREEDVLKAVQSGYPDLEYLPSRNKAKLAEQGIDTCRKRLHGCYSVEKE